MSICMLTLTTRDFRPDFKTKSMSTTHAITKWNLSVHWNEVKFDPPHWNQVNLDHPHKNKVNFHAHSNIKWFSASMQVTCQLLPPTQQPDRFYAYTEISSSMIPYTEMKSISTTITKNKLISILTLKTSNFDPHTEARLILTPAQEACQFRSSH